MKIKKKWSFYKTKTTTCRKNCKSRIRFFLLLLIFFQYPSRHFFCWYCIRSVPSLVKMRTHALKKKRSLIHHAYTSWKWARQVLGAVTIKAEWSHRVIYDERNDKQSASYLLILSLLGALTRGLSLGGSAYQRKPWGSDGATEPTAIMHSATHDRLGESRLSTGIAP